MFDFKNEDWQTTDINVDSLWIIDKRDSTGKHANIYHGNFVPQIPYQLIRRYTSKNDIVLDLFSGSGTTLFECEKLQRDFIGFDINSEINSYVTRLMGNTNKIKYFINCCDNTDSDLFDKYIKLNLSSLNKEYVDFVIAHPPYMDIVKFTDNPLDLSQISDIDLFTSKFIQSLSNGIRYLKKNGYFALVIGDVYKNSEVVPLGFHLMNAIKNSFKCKLKGIIIKNIEGNRGKIGVNNIWKYRALKYDYYIFKHEYVFVFKKTGDL